MFPCPWKSLNIERYLVEIDHLTLRRNKIYIKWGDSEEGTPNFWAPWGIVKGVR